MKKITVCIVLLLISTVLLFACSYKSDTVEEPAYISSDRMDETVKLGNSLHEGNRITGSPFVGTFVCTYSGDGKCSADELYTDGNIPFLYMYENGDFMLSAYNFEKETAVSVAGTFVVDGETAVLTFTDKPENVYCNDQAEIKLLDEDSIKWLDNGAESVAQGDIFCRFGD